MPLRQILRSFSDALLLLLFIAAITWLSSAVCCRPRCFELSTLDSFADISSMLISMLRLISFRHFHAIFTPLATPPAFDADIFHFRYYFASQRFIEMILRMPRFR
jgi:hypothetical protein